jgi:hypothetical protein
MAEDMQYRKELARELLAAKVDDVDLELAPDLLALRPAALAAGLPLAFPGGLKPVPKPLAAIPNPNDALPRADVLAVTWTVDEQDAMCDVLTPGHDRKTWYRYRRHFDDRYRGKIRAGAPSLTAGRLGSWFPIEIGSKKVICFKSELHLNQDGIETSPGRATLPVKDLFAQLIAEVQPAVVLTVGTAGATFLEHDLGDVVVTRGAKFRLQMEFAQEEFANTAYSSDWQLPTTHFAKAVELMKISKEHLAEPSGVTPTGRYRLDGAPPVNDPDIKLDDGTTMPRFHPILTTDFYEFGTSKNRLDHTGSGLEMGDAVLGMACGEMAQPPKWAVVRNLSDPQINGDLPDGPGRELNIQAAWAVYYYRKYGYWTSVNSALATWAIVAGL